MERERWCLVVLASNQVLVWKSNECSSINEWHLHSYHGILRGWVITSLDLSLSSSMGGTDQWVELRFGGSLLLISSTNH